MSQSVSESVSQSVYLFACLSVCLYRHLVDRVILKCIILFLPAPLHHPVPILMYNTSSTSLRVAWGEVPDSFHHGEVMGYRVFLEETGHEGVIVANRSFQLHVNSTNFTGLKRFTSYEAHVRAYSFFGEGPDGVVTTLTDEDSEFLPLKRALS